MKLYELTDDFIKLESMLDGSETEADSLAFTQLWDEINIAFEEKAEKTACVIRNLEAEAEAIKVEEQRLQARRKALENNAKRVKDYLEVNMKNSAVTKITGKLFTLSIQKNPPALKTDPALLPDEYWIIKREPNNAKAKEDLKNGIEVPGAWLEQGESLRIK